MRMHVLIATVIYVLSFHGLALGEEELDPSALQLIVSSELKAMNLPVASPFCLAVSNGDDPSEQVLANLSRAGFKPRKASICYKKLRGHLISVDTAQLEANVLTVGVRSGDLRVQSGHHFGTLMRRGKYSLEMKKERGVWSIRSYDSDINTALNEK